MSKFEENIERSVKSLAYITDMQVGKAMTVELTHYTAEPPKEDRPGEVVFTILISTETGSPELSDIADELSNFAKKTYDTLMGYTFNSDGILVKRTEEEYYESSDMMGLIYKLSYDNNHILKCEISNYFNVFSEE
jgi:hypothetical protein